MTDLRKDICNSKRIVIKVGTSTLTYDTGKINFTRMDKLARVISDLVNQGREVVLVTSGAIGVGAGKLNMPHAPGTIMEKQAAAAVGQSELMHIYSKLFSEYNHVVAQILLTRDVVSDQTGRINVVNTFETLLKKSIVPIVNENDTVSVAEIKAGELYTFSENDNLSALVSKMIDAHLLIILSDIDGFYDCDPRVNSCPKLISVVDKITPELENYAGGTGSGRGSGGMYTKLSAAKIAVSAGVDMVLANGDDPSVIFDVLNGEDVGTLFKSQGK